MSISKRIRVGVSVLAVGFSLCLVGCVTFSQNIRMPPRLGGPTVALKTFSPPTGRLGQDVRTLGVAHFGAAAAADRPWAEAVAVATSRQLAANLQAFPRYGLACRGNPGELLGDPPAGEVYTRPVAAEGRKAKVDAVICGNVGAATGGRLELVVEFALVRSRDGRVLDRWSYRGRYGESSAAESVRPVSVTLEALLAGKAGRPSVSPAAVPAPPPRAALCQEAGRYGAEQVCPHWRVLEVPLASSGGEHGEAGRSAAAAGDMMAALLSFRRAVRFDPRDPGAWYNVAVIYEARGEWEKAQDAYQRAVNIYDITPFRRGLVRVGRELDRLAASTVAKG